jgi:siroheme synthase-like protein
MSGYPIVLTQLSERRCIIIGGGPVAARKAQALVDAGARPVVVSPVCVPELDVLAASGAIERGARAYEPGDLDGASLVIAATDDGELNATVAADCRRRNVLINVVDAPALCTFTAPAVVRRGDLLVAISTDGQAPAFARHVRETLESVLDERYGELLAILAELRPQIRYTVPQQRQAALWSRLLDGEVSECLCTEGCDPARDLACSIVADYSRPASGGDD